jgi:hypothetical protein
MPLDRDASLLVGGLVLKALGEKGENHARELARIVLTDKSASEVLRIAQHLAELPRARRLIMAEAHRKRKSLITQSPL